MTTLFVMLLGMGAGRFVPMSQKKMVERVQLVSTLLLIFSMGAGLGQREGFFSELGVLGLKSFLFFVIPTLCSVAMVYPLTQYFLAKAKGRPQGRAESWGTEECGMDGAKNGSCGTGDGSGDGPAKGDPMMFWALAALLLGIGGGSIPALSGFLGVLSTHSQWVLYLLMFFVGISVGFHKGIWAELRRYHVKILVIPLGILAGSLAGGALCGLLLGYPAGQAVSVAGGLGWYSLAGVSVGSLGGAELGSLAFLSNLMREIGSFFLIPFIARYLNAYTCIAPAAATSEDTTLPMLIRHTDGETAVLAVLNGMICSTFVPVVISLCY